MTQVGSLTTKPWDLTLMNVAAGRRLWTDPPVFLRLNPKAHYVICTSVTFTCTAAATQTINLFWLSKNTGAQEIEC